MKRTLCVLVICGSCLLTNCRGRVEDSSTVTMIIESSPNNLDLRQGTDAQSERVGGLIFDALVRKDEHYELQPWLATSWEQPNPTTWRFHLRHGVKWHSNATFKPTRDFNADDVLFSFNRQGS